MQEKEEEEVDFSEDEGKQKKGSTSIKLEKIRFEDVKERLERASVNDKTLKGYCTAYNVFAEKVKVLPNEEEGEADEVIER